MSGAGGIPAGRAGQARAKPTKPRPLPDMWTGITGPDCDKCSWSWRDGRREIKVLSAACGVHCRAGQAPEHGAGGGGG